MGSMNSNVTADTNGLSCADGSLTPDDFPDFFRDVHDHEPFPWQERLTKQVLRRGVWPKVIDLPTGAGKTAVLDTAVFALAAQPSRFPRRIVFVIDRRIVVDQVCKRAQRIQDRIETGRTPTLQRVRDHLRMLSGGVPLGVAALRGGIPMDHEWTHRPDQPWVVVSTVDQFGSRLLFRGYGVTPGMRPIHAGLAGNDCLVILDEVHLSVPFAETLAQVAALKWGELPRRFGVVEVSATPCNTEAERFTLDPASDLDGCEELERRMGAVKKADLQLVKNHDALPNAVLKIVKTLDNSRAGSVAKAGVHSVGVVVNRVGTARKTFKVLQAAGFAAHLITGRMRPLDRVEALGRIAPAVDPEGKSRDGDLVVVVATQAIEVGADFSFDALITECAAIDSLRQRFGRLDRRGLCTARTGAAARAWIIGIQSVVGSGKPDPIYGDSVKITWEELKRQHEERKQQHGDEGWIDVGPCALLNFPAGATAPKASAPLLLRTHMDAWTQTRPEPIVQPAVDWFLHGIDHNQRTHPDVSVLWRWDRSPEVLQLVPPRQAEFLQVPIDAARSWLSGGREVDVSDAGQAQAEGDGSSPPPDDDHGADWVRWEGFGKEDPGPIGVGEIRPGDVLIVDPSRGGLSAGTWDPSATDLVTDLGDAAQIAYDSKARNCKATLRLDPRLLGATSMPLPASEDDADVPPKSRLGQWLSDRLAEPGDRPGWFGEAVQRLSSGFELTPVGPDATNLNDSYYVLSQRHPDTQCPVVDPVIMDGSDESGSLTGTGVTLGRHLDGVGERAGGVAERLGLATELVDDLRLAGRLHDVGKVDRRFQAQLVGGDPIALEMLKEPLAKSVSGIQRIRRYPPGMRHEIASVAMIESNTDVLNSAHDKDLVLHLVGTHHGWARPLPPIVEDPQPQTLSYTFDGHCLVAGSDLTESSLALDMADRFWRLVERYGYHGLAWLEAILRLSDHQQSAEEATQR